MQKKEGTVKLKYINNCASFIGKHFPKCFYLTKINVTIDTKNVFGYNVSIRKHFIKTFY